MPKEAILERQTTLKMENGKLHFRYLPEFALFIKDNCLVPYILEQIRISKEIDLPMLRFFSGMPDSDLVAMSIESHKTFLTSAYENTLNEHLEKSIEGWVADQLGIIKRDEIKAEDITLSGYMRKKAMLKFLPSYTADVRDAIDIINEIDTLAAASDTAATNVYIRLLRERINEQRHFSESISDITPGLNYIFDLENRFVKFANKNYLDYFGSTLQELQESGLGIPSAVMHPDDLENHNHYLNKFAEVADKEVISWEYRLKDIQGNYHWMRTYTSVFRRDKQHVPVEIIGIILNVDEAKRTSELLMESRQHLMKAQELSQVGNWTWNLTTGKIDWTDALYNIYGIPLGTELNFDDITAYSGTEERLRSKERLQHCITTLEPVETYYHITLKDGTEKILHTKTEAFGDHSGKVSKVIGVIQDVTEKQLLIERLQQSDELFKQAQAISHIGNWSWDMETKKAEYSDEVYRIYESDFQSPGKGTSFIEYTHPEDIEMLKGTIKEALDTQKPFDFNYRIILRSGEIKMIHAKGEVKPTANKSYKIYSTIQDITEQKIIEKQLNDYQEFIKKITDVTPSIITAYNINTGKYSFINQAIEKLLGYPPSKIMDEGVPFLTSIMHPDDLPVIMEKNTKAIEDANLLLHNDNEPIVEFKYRMRNANGEYRWFHTYGTIFERNNKGFVESVLNISVDITGQEAAEQSLFQKNLQLQQSNTSLEEYAYVASHDLKEPLRKIATFSDRILTTQQATLNDDGKTYLSKIIDSSKRMQKMISDLLSVSMILGNKAHEMCDLNILLSEALEALDHKIEESRAVIKADDLPSVFVVRSQFRQLFQNLVSNSLKFARPGIPSHIKITYKSLNYKAVEHLNLAKAKKYLEIKLEDNGIGFENEYSGKIFAIFQRLHGKTEYDGTGIGLAICKKIVENHDGIISAKGAVNQGAVFTIVIPV